MWQMLVRNWLLSAAKEKLHEAHSQAAAGQGGQAENAAPGDPPATPEVCHVGLVFALGIESGALVDRLSGVVATHGQGFVAREGGLEGRRIVVVEGGATQPAAARAARALIAGHKPRWLISAGFAGGLVGELKKGHILMADEVADVAGRSLRVDLKIDPAVLAATPGVHVGRLLTVDRLVHDAAQKLSLGQAHRALACDMETMAVAEVCREEKVRFLSVRIISDAVDEQLSPELDLLVRKKSTAGRLGAATRAIINRPSSIKDMWRLKEDALVASERLAKFLAGILSQLGE
jgi:adenosylhomocysteine nucleosidase